MTPRVLVLGGGSSQLALLARCRERGLHVVLADRDPRAPGRMQCDAFEPASTFDRVAVLDAAKRHRVDAVMTAGTDQPVLVAASVAAELGLPSFLSPETALAVTNKRVMKARFDAAGIPCAPWVLVGPDAPNLDLRALRPPFVTKPVDSQGQRGVYLMPDAASVRAVAADVLSFSREDRLLVEEFYPGPEVTFSGWVHRGTLTVLSVTDRVTVSSEPHIGVCFAHRYPSFLESRQEQIVELARSVVDGFSIAEGPVYFQFLVGERGAIVNEISCRLGGAYEDRFVPAVTGVDLLDLLIDGSLGRREPPLPGAGFEPGLAPRCVSVPLLFCRPGTIASLSDLGAVRSLPGVLAAHWLLEPGATIGPLANSTQRAGYLIVAAADRASVNERIRHALSLLRVRDHAGSELLIDATPYSRHPEPR